jgi:hypothetical protein
VDLRRGTGEDLRRRTGEDPRRRTGEDPVVKATALPAGLGATEAVPVMVLPGEAMAADPADPVVGKARGRDTITTTTRRGGSGEPRAAPRRVRLAAPWRRRRSSAVRVRLRCMSRCEPLKS